MNKFYRATPAEISETRGYQETDSKGRIWDFDGEIESHEYAEFYNFMVTICRGDKQKSYMIREEFEHECEPGLNLAEEIGCMYEAMADAAQDR